MILSNRTCMQYRKTIAVLLTLLLVSVCRLPAFSDSPFPADVPENQGISSSSLDELMRVIQEWFDSNVIVGGEILIVKNRRTVLHEAVGWKDREKRKSWELNTLCNIRSMSKPITGAAAQILIDRGMLSPNDPAALYIPGFNNDSSKEITLQLLLSHRSGLPLTLMAQGFISDTLYELANLTGEEGPQFQPDSKFWYSDAGTEVVGAIVERISGQLLNRFITEQLLVPLGMNDSFSWMPDGKDNPIWDRIASSYAGSPGSWTKFWSPDQKQTFYRFALGSQSIYGTPLDYAKFLAMWMDEGLALDGTRILSPEAISRTLTPLSPMSQLGSDQPMLSGLDGLGVFYGQLSILYAPSEGNVIGKPVAIGHSGSDGTWAWAWPEHDLMVLFFTQSRGQSAGMRLETWIDRLIVHAGELPIVPNDFRPYVGSYLGVSSELKNRIYKIDVLHGKLALDISGYPLFTLKPPDSQGRWYAENIPNVNVSFLKDSNGNISGMRFSEGGSSFRFDKMQSTPVRDWQIYETIE